MLWIIVVCALAVLGWSRFAAPDGWGMIGDLAVLCAVGASSGLALLRRSSRGGERPDQEHGWFYHNLFDAMSEIVFIIDPDLRISHVNEAQRQWCKEYGLDVDVIGEPLLEAYPVLPEQVGKDLREIFETGNGSGGVRRLEINGARRAYEVTRSPVMKNGTVTHVAVVIRDITQAEQVEEELVRRTDRLSRHRSAIIHLTTHEVMESPDASTTIQLITKTAAEAMQVERVGVWLFSEDGAELRCLDLFEQSTDEHSEESVLAMKEYPAYAHALSTGRAINAHEARRDPRTSEFTASYLEPLDIWSLMDAPIRYEGRIVGVLCFEQTNSARQWHEDEIAFAGEVADQVALAFATRDRRQAEEALRHSEERFRRLSTCGFEGLFIHDRGQIIDANDAMAKMFNCVVDDLVGCDAFNLAAQESRDQVRARMDTTGEEPDTVLALRTDGTQFPAEIRSQEIFSDDRLLRVVSVRDITEQREAQEQLKKSQGRYRELCRGSRDGYVWIDLEGNILECNEAFAAMVGRSEQSLLGVNFRVFTPERWHASEDSIIAEQIKKHGHSEVYDKEYIRADGTVFPVELQAYLVRDEHARPEAMWAVVRDITERRRFEEQLKRSESRYRELCRGSRDGYVWINLVGEIIECNEAFAEMLGRSEQSLLGKNFREITPGRWHEMEYRILFAQIFKRGHSDLYVKEYQHADGRNIPVELQAYLIRDEENQPFGTWAVVRDISERRRVEEQLELTKQTVDHSGVASFWVDPDDHVYYVNEAACDLMGYPQEELIGSHIKMFAPEFDGGPNPKLWARLKEVRSFAIQSELVRRDGSVFPAEITANYIEYEGRVYNCSFVVDISERIQAQEELSARAETERLLLRELDHRVRNNLAALLALIDMSKASASDVDRFAKAIRGRVQTMATVHSMLARGKWESITLRDLITKLTPPMSEGGIHIEGPVISITARQAHALGLAVNELLTNSQKYGALSTHGATVMIEWAICDDSSDARCSTDSPCITMTWREIDGPPIEQSPTAGLGTTLIEGLIRAELGGGITFNYPRTGVDHRIEFHLDEAPLRSVISSANETTRPESK